MPDFVAVAEVLALDAEGDMVELDRGLELWDVVQWVGSLGLVGLPDRTRPGQNPWTTRRGTCSVKRFWIVLFLQCLCDLCLLNDFRCSPPYS